MQPMNMIMFYYCNKRNGDHLEHVLRKMYAMIKRHQINVVFFFYCYYISFQDRQYFLSFLSQQWIIIILKGCIYLETVLSDFFLQISRTNILQIFFFSCPRHCDRGLIVVKVCYVQIWNKNRRNISRVVSSHMGPIYIKIPYKLN